jgi:cytochrome c peroxidase
MVRPLGLTSQEKSDLVAFLKALTGEPITFEMPKLPK